MKISIAMPAYNASKYITDMMKSILSQDFEDFELVVLDDASTDNTYTMMQKFKRHPRVRLYKNRRNLGVGASRNKLIQLSRGKYICPCDADDIMLPGNLKRLSRFLDQNPGFGAVYADMLVIEMKNKKNDMRPPIIISEDRRNGWDLIDNLVHHAGSMIRKRILLQVGGYNQELYSAEDWDLWLKISEITKIKHLKGEIYYVYRRHAKSLTRTTKRFDQDVFKIRQAAIQRRYGVKL